MSALLPAQEVKDILGESGFLHSNGQDESLYISDAPRRVTSETLTTIQNKLKEQGFSSSVNNQQLLLIDLQLIRWRMLLGAFPHITVESLPDDDRLLDVYALARLLLRHPAPLEQQPFAMIRAVLKHYDRIDSLPALTSVLHSRCAERLRCKEPLPSALADVLYTWLKEQKEEEHG